MAGVGSRGATRGYSPPPPLTVHDAEKRLRSRQAQIYHNRPFWQLKTMVKEFCAVSHLQCNRYGGATPPVYHSLSKYMYTLYIINNEHIYQCIYSYIMSWFLYSWTFCPGRISRQQDIELQLLLEPNVERPVFTLTCVTTGGPPTTVTWTRDGTAIDYQNNSSFRFSRTVTDFVAATYNNTLTVTGNFPGLYNISAQNRNTAQYVDSTAATATLQVEGKCLYISVHELHCLWYLTP